MICSMDLSSMSTPFWQNLSLAVSDSRRRTSRPSARLVACQIRRRSARIWLIAPSRQLPLVSPPSRLSRSHLSNAPILIHPDYAKPFLLYVDACRKGIAAGLYQVGSDGKEHPVLFISRTLRHAEKNYAATELECLAVVWALKKLAHYVDGSQLTLITDHSALKWIWSVKETVNQRLFHWSLLLNPLKDKVNIVHRPGRLNNNVDPLSHSPVLAYLTTTLVSISDEWRLKLQSAYPKNKHFRAIWKKLGVPSGGVEKGTQTDATVVNVWATTRAMRRSQETGEGPEVASEAAQAAEVEGTGTNI